MLNFGHFHFGIYIKKVCSLVLYFCFQLDHYPPVSYRLPEASDTQFNHVKTLFLGKVYGEFVNNLTFFFPGTKLFLCQM